MAITFACAACGKQFSVDPALAGKRGKCKGCGAPMTVPRATPAAGEVDDPYGLGDASDAAEADEPRAILPRSGGGRRPGGPGHARGGVPAWVWLGGGAVGLLVVVLVVATVLSRPGPPRIAAPVLAPVLDGEDSKVVIESPRTLPPDVAAGLGKGDAPVPADRFGWNVRPDPAAEPVVFPAVEKLSLMIPEAFSGDRVLYPTTPSPFVLLGGNDNDEQFREVWDLRTAKRVGRLAGHIEVARPLALSPDGAYFATHTNPVPRTNDVWRVADATRVARIEDGENIADVIDFAGPGRVVVGTSYAQILKVWDFLAVKPLVTIETAAGFDKESLAFSPGRRYLALLLAQKNKLVFYDLTDGRVKGEVAMQKEGAGSYDCEGMAFSPDGTALAGLFTLGGSNTHLMCWDAASGKLVSDFISPGTDPYGKSFNYEGQAVQWLPDQSGWLILDQTFVERQGGQVVWSLPFSPARYLEHGPRKVLDLGRIVTVAEAKGKQSLRLAPLPEDKIRAAIGLVKGGKSAIDAVLPATTTADLSGARKVAPAPGPVAWTPAPASPPAPKAQAARSIPVRVAAGDVLGLLASGPGEGSEALVISSPGGRLSSNAGGKQGQAARRVGRFDLAGGRPLDDFEIPSVSMPIALSPGATHLLMAHASGLDRLDLHASAGGKHLAGWRPYDGESGDARDVAWADFLDAGRVLTVNRAGTLILWSVPGCKAVYVAPGAMEGVPVLGPGRKSLAVLHDGTLRFLDPATGESRGDGPSTGRPGAAGLNVAAFSPDGQELAAVLDGSIVRWDLKAGRVIGEFPSPSPMAGSLQYGDARHVLLDGKALVDLEARRLVWSYEGGAHAQGDVGPVHRYVAADQYAGPATLRSVDIPDKAAARAEAALADPKVPALVRDGLTIGIQVIGEPPRDAEKFRRDLVEGLAGQLRKAGVEVADGRPGRLVVKFDVKETGKTIEYRKFSAKGGEPEKRSMPDRRLDWELAVADDKGAPIVIARDSVPFSANGLLESIPNGENDWEGFLRAKQFVAGASAVLKHGVPYYVARRPDGGVILPGRTSLGYPPL